MRKYVLIIIFALFVFLGYRPVKELILSLRGTSFEEGVLRCDYQGRSYADAEQRQADDGCNVCTCGASGWSCTKIACIGGAGTGTINGRLSMPSGDVLPAQRVCAMNVKNTEQEYCQQTTEGAENYAVAVKPGEYWVYATRIGDESGKRAYWSEYVKCGGLETCKNHSPILTQVTANGIAQADPQDWSARVQIDLLNVTPSKWEYTTHNYYPDSVFLVRSHGLTEVKVMATEYPPNPDAEAYELGKAKLAKDEQGSQTWTLAIPKGFQAGTVYVIGMNAEGEYTTSHALRIVRPIETAN